MKCKACVHDYNGYYPPVLLPNNFCNGDATYCSNIATTSNQVQATAKVESIHFMNIILALISGYIIHHHHFHRWFRIAECVHTNSQWKIQ